MRVTVLLFASARELCGRDREELELPEGACVADALAALAARTPELLRMPLVFARNREYAARDTRLAPGDELALIPPISGGSGAPRFLVRLQHEPIDPRPLEALVRSDQDGALITFLGVTRDHHEGRAVLHLSYEAYAPMAVERIERILAEVAAVHQIGRAAVVHRLGEVAVGQTSIAVVVAAPHRGEAFAACRAVMDRIKAEVPIFKKEQYGDGARWVGELPRP